MLLHLTNLWNCLLQKWRFSVSKVKAYRWGYARESFSKTYLLISKPRHLNM